jgi:general stress protein 26
MPDKSLEDIGETMRDIDFCMMTTRRGDGGLAARPMSNNREVDYDGDSFFFSDGNTDKVRELESDPHVTLAFQGKQGLLGKPGAFIAVEGRAELIRDKAEFAERWTKDLDRWFEQGIDTPGLTLIKVHAERIHWWDDGEGEIRL